jgi:hypothetical protein
MKKIALIFTLMLLSQVVAMAQPQRVLFAIRGFGSSSNPNPTQALTYVNLTTGVVRDSIAAIGPLANVIRVRNNRLYIVNSGANFNGTANSLQIINIADIVSNIQPLAVQTIPIANGRNPYDMVFLNDTKAYISNYLDTSVVVFNANTNTFGRRTLIGNARQAPQGLTIANNKLYVALPIANSATFAYDSTVVVINTVNDDTIRSIRVGLNPQTTTLDRLGRLHTVCSGNFGTIAGTISVIDPSSDVVLTSFNVGGSPSGVMFSSQNIGILGNGTRYDGTSFNFLSPAALGGAALDFGDTLFAVRTSAVGQPRRLVLQNARTLDSLTQFILGTSQPYSGLATTTIGTSSVSSPPLLSKEFTLAQNFPNPFNPSTVIRYQLSATTEVRLEVVDVLGRKMVTLVNQKQSSGDYSASFNAANLASGVYFYRLQAGSFVETRKMMLVK